MADSRLGWFVSILIGCVLVAGVVLTFRMSRAHANEHETLVVPENAGRIYRDRMRATETFTEGGFLEVSQIGGR